MDWLTVVDKGGVLALLVLILWTGHKEAWVWGKAHRRVVTERDEWKELALRGVRTAETAVTAAELTVRREG